MYSKKKLKKQIDKLTKDFCNKCKKEMSYDCGECKTCWVHWLQNELLEMNNDE